MAREALAERLARLRMPFVFAVVLTLVAAARFDGLRPVEGQYVALGLPLFTTFSGAGPFHEANTGLRRVVFALALLLAFAAELGIYSALFGGGGGALSPAAARLVFGACGIAAIVLQGVAAQRGFRSRLAAWLCMAAVFASYFINHVNQKDLFGSTLGALMVSLFVGGGSGLLLGELSVKLLRGR
ncbi:MAG TPA: hypothetical protein VGM29_11760 [Polyangiaceae bacterium]